MSPLNGLSSGAHSRNHGGNDPGGFHGTVCGTGSAAGREFGWGGPAPAGILRKYDLPEGESYPWADELNPSHHQNLWNLLDSKSREPETIREPRERVVEVPYG